MQRNQSLHDRALESAVKEAKIHRKTHAVTRNFSVKESSLRYHLQKANQIESGRKHTHRLSNIQEKAVVNWILQQEAGSRAPNRQAIRDFTQELSNTNPPLSNN